MGSLQDKKIIFVFGCLDLGGSERQGFQLARYLKEKCGADVHVVGLSEKPGRLAEMCDEHGIPWHGIRFHWSGFWPLRLKEIHRFTKDMRTLDADILLPYYTLPNTVCGLVWQKVGARLCVWNQRDEGLLLTRNIWHRTAVERTPRFVANANGGRDFLVKTYGIDPGLITVIHNGISLASPVADRSRWRMQLKIGADCFAVCMIANLGPYKDHETLIRAWKNVVDRTPSSGERPVLLLAGRPDSGENVLKSLASRLLLDDTVRFLGKVDDIAGLLSAVDLCIHSSKTEGCPNGVLEAMAAGLPVIGTDIPGIREAVGEAGNGFLVPVGDHQRMADAIARLVGDPELCVRYGEVLKKRIDEEFSLDQMCRKSVILLSDALAGSV
jgi:glycosyltransferase involved in cell wall biosynthesis